MSADLTARSRQERQVGTRAVQRIHAEDESKKRIWSNHDDSAVHEAETDDGTLLTQRTPKRRRRSYAYSVPPSPTDRANLGLAKVKGYYLDLAKVDQRLTEINEMREWGEACRSDGESSWGDDDLARLTDWDCIDLGEEQQRDTPMRQHDSGEEDEDEDEEEEVEEQRDNHDEVPIPATTKVHVVEMHHSSRNKEELNGSADTDNR